MSVELAWAAGIIDGEGCISIACVNPSTRNDLVHPSYRLVLKVTMGHLPTIQRLYQILGTGSLQDHVSNSEKVNDSWSWIAQSRKAETVLKSLQPYLVTKADECVIALEFMALPDVKRGGRGGSPSIALDLLRRKHDLYIACAKAKPRTRFRKTPLIERPEWY